MMQKTCRQICLPGRHAWGSSHLLLGYCYATTAEKAALVRLTTKDSQ